MRGNRRNRRKDGCFSRIATTAVSVHVMQQYRPYELMVCVFIYEYTPTLCSPQTSVAGGLRILMITAPHASSFLPLMSVQLQSSQYPESSALDM